MHCNAEIYYVGKISRTGIGRPSKQRGVVLRRRTTVVGGKCALPSALLVPFQTYLVHTYLIHNFGNEQKNAQVDNSMYPASLNYSGGIKKNKYSQTKRTILAKRTDNDINNAS